jgi:hypothetical protein
MEIVLGGYFEMALVRFTDAIVRPERSRTGHPYYLCLNRTVRKTFFERSATFIALADEVIVPSINWAAPSATEPGKFNLYNLGLRINDRDYGGRECDDDSSLFANIVLNRQALPESWTHISPIDGAHLKFAGPRKAKQERAKLSRIVAHHYLCRLFLHVRATSDANAMLVLSEPDIQVHKEIGIFLEDQDADPFCLSRSRRGRCSMAITSPTVFSTFRQWTRYPYRP